MGNVEERVGKTRMWKYAFVEFVLVCNFESVGETEHISGGMVCDEGL